MCRRQNRAEQLDSTSVDDPFEIIVDESGIGLLVSGPVSQHGLENLEAARDRERTVAAESDRCWSDSGGAQVIAELQSDAMREAESLIASANDESEPVDSKWFVVENAEVG